MSSKRMMLRLVEAVENGDCAAIRSLNESGLDLDSSIDGKTAIHFAIESQSVRSVRELLSLGVDSDARDKDGFTPLMSACSLKGAKGEKIVMMLLNNSVKIGARTSVGVSAFGMACRFAKPSVVEALIARGATVNGTARDSMSPAMNAIRGGRLDNLRLLVEHGCDLSKSVVGTSCLEFAQQHGTPAITRFVQCQLTGDR